MRLALEDAGLSAEEVGHVNAHATSTPTGDGPETKAVSRFMPHAAVSGTKSMTGHSFGAVGTTEGIMCALALKHKMLPPTINLDNLAEDCESLDYVGRRQARSRTSRPPSRTRWASADTTSW